MCRGFIPEFGKQWKGVAAERKLAVLCSTMGMGMDFIWLSQNFPERWTVCVRAPYGDSRGQGRITKGCKLFLMTGTTRQYLDGVKKNPPNIQTGTRDGGNKSPQFQLE